MAVGTATAASSVRMRHFWTAAPALRVYVWISDPSAVFQLYRSSAAGCADGSDCTLTRFTVPSPASRASHWA